MFPFLYFYLSVPLMLCQRIHLISMRMVHHKDVLKLKMQWSAKVKLCYMQPQIILLWLQPWKKRPHCLYLWLWSASDMFLVTIKKSPNSILYQTPNSWPRRETGNSKHRWNVPSSIPTDWCLQGIKIPLRQSGCPLQSRKAIPCQEWRGLVQFCLPAKGL